MSSEHATEQVSLAEIQEGDTIQDPKSGNWTTVIRSDGATTSVTHRYPEGERTVAEDRDTKACQTADCIVRVARTQRESRGLHLRRGRPLTYVATCRRRTLGDGVARPCRKCARSRAFSRITFWAAR
jgi:aspartate oxidase